MQQIQGKYAFAFEGTTINTSPESASTDMSVTLNDFEIAVKLLLS